MKILAYLCTIAAWSMVGIQLAAPIMLAYIVYEHMRE